MLLLGGCVASPSATPPTGVSCLNRVTLLACADVVVNGHIFRYSLSRATKPTARTIVLDVGGPGTAVLNSGAMTGFLAGQPGLDEVNVLVVEEPWVTRDPTADCSTATAAFDRAVRGVDVRTATVAGHKLARSCEITRGGWGFDRQSYLAVLTAIRDQERLEYHGFVGESFGSVRLSYLAGSPIARGLDWAVLNHPFPTATPIERLVADRAAAVRDQVRRLNPRGGTLPTPDPGFATSSAMVELGYLAEADQQQVTHDVLSGHYPGTVTQLSDQLWQRSDDAQVSPGLLAQVQEVCEAVRGTVRTVAAPGTVEWVLRASLLPCGQGANVEPPRLGDLPVCIATVADDTVTPEVTTFTALHDISSRVSWVREATGGHRSTRGLTNCLHRLMA